MLRHFDRTGKLLGSSGPQSQFLKLDAAEHRLTSGFIVATSDRLGWYGPHSGRHGQYVEIDFGSMTMHSYVGLPDLSPDRLVVCFSLTGSGNAFLSLYDNTAGRSTTFRFDRAALKWLPMKLPATSESPGAHLIGVDGEQLVFWSGNSAIFFSPSQRALGGIAALAWVAAWPLAAQNRAADPNTEADQRLLAEIRSGNELMTSLEYLSDMLGP